uniref:TIGR01621 family pseudouridine synthase n=1 Tax=Thaumasiovibrio occultus TaxID=1891184 RepID=UPI000B34E445|nr:TIGR01621 family pseudouridine synthase [Thaumasiovibrio occultus]
MYKLIENNPSFVVIDKLPGISVHKDDGDTPLVASVAADLGLEQLYLVHRLDKMTSGLLLLAKNADAAATLSGLFAARQVEKFYLAIGEKKPSKKQGLISGDMARSRRSSWKLLPSKRNPAVTQFFSLAGEQGQRLFLCKPHTGKTHQIRVALKSVGSAIVGDPIYGNPADRGYLHAYQLAFEYEQQPFRFQSVPSQGELWQTDAMKAALTEWHTPHLLAWPTIKNGKTS